MGFLWVASYFAPFACISMVVASACIFQFAVMSLLPVASLLLPSSLTAFKP